MRNQFFAVALSAVLFAPFGAAAQTTVDSLQQVFRTAPHDTLKWIALFHISQHYAKSNLDSSLAWAQRGLDFARQYAPHFVPRSLNNVGLQYMNKGNSDRAMEHYLQAIESAKQHNCAPCIATTTGNMGIIAWNKREYDKAEQYCQDAIALTKSLRDTVGQARYLNNLGLVQIDKAQLEKAEQTFESALQLLEAVDTVCIQPTIYSNLGNIAYARGKYPRALSFYKLASKWAEKINDGSAAFLGVNNAGWAQLAMKNYDEAIRLFIQSKAIADKHKNDKYAEQAIGALADAYKAKGDFPNAFSALEKYLQLHDTIVARQSSKAVMELETRYQTQQKEAAIRDLENQQHVQKILTYSALGGILALLLVLWLSRRASRQRRLLQQATIDRLESERKVVALNAHLEGQQLERLRIAEDLHDDFGSGLSKISLLSEVAKKKTTPTELDKIAATAKELLLKMGEVVWALNHHNDTLPSLAAYIRRYAVGFFEDSGVRCHFNIPDLPDAPLSGETRRNIFLVVKESLHNILKHAGASKVDIDFSLKNNNLEVKIHDDGQGFDEAALAKAGNGLRNMEKRMRNAGGSFEIESATGEGTTVRLGLPLVEEAAVELVRAA